MTAGTRKDYETRYAIVPRDVNFEPGMFHIAKCRTMGLSWEEYVSPGRSVQGVANGIRISEERLMRMRINNRSLNERIRALSAVVGYDLNKVDE